MPSNTNPQVTYQWLISQLVDEDIMVPGDPGTARGFGATALKVNGKIFAMLSSKSEFVVKLPGTRVTELVTQKVGKQFDSGRGRLMKEWLVVASTDGTDWLKLAQEALQFARKH